MKYLNHLTALLLSAVILSSCEKEEIKTTPLTSLNITNAIVGGTTARLGSNATNISNNGSAQMAVVAGENSLYVYS